MNKYLKIICFLTAITILSPLNANAASDTQAAGILDRTASEIEVPEGFELNSQSKPPLHKVDKASKIDDKIIIGNLKQIAFSGYDVIDLNILNQISAPYLNRDITAADVAKLKFALTSHYYDKGFILVKIVTPEQNLKSGILKIDIYEARIGQILVQDNDVLNAKISNAFINHLHSGDIFTEQSVETMITGLNNLSGITSTLNLRKGQAFGQTDLIISHMAADEDVQYISVDNYGSALTGEIVTTGYFEVSNIAHLGEKVHATMRRSDGDLWSIAIGGQLPIAVHNLILKFYYLHSENEIGDRLAAAQSSGATDILSLAISSDIYNTRKENLAISAGFEARKHQTFSKLTGLKLTIAEDDIRQAFLQTSYVMRKADAVYYSVFKLVRNLDWLGADDEGTGRSDPNASQNLWRLQPTLYANILSPISDGAFTFSARGQYSTNRTLSSDLFAIGGYGSVRGFDPAFETGESGYAFTAEYGHNFPDLGDFSITFGPFLDGGAVFNRGISAIDSHIYSAGLALELEADLISANPTNIRLDFARPIGSYNSTLVDDNQFFIRLTQKF